MSDNFWKESTIPFQTEEADFQYANPVVVAQKYLWYQAQAAYLGEKAEGLTSDIGSLSIKLEDAEKGRKALRSRLLAQNYKTLTKSASSEVQDAYVLNCAITSGQLVYQEYLDFENTIKIVSKQIAEKQNLLNKYKNRMAHLRISLECATQYLNFEKHITRMDSR